MSLAENFGVTLYDIRSGLQSQIYERAVKGKTEYTYATVGTQMNNTTDTIQDALQVAGASKHYSQSANNA